MNDFSKMSNAELRRLEADRNTSAEAWRGAVAEIASRERMPLVPTAAPMSNAYTPAREHATRVTITSIDLSFWAWVRLIFTVTLASIPAMIFVAVVATIVATLLGALGVALSHHP